VLRLGCGGKDIVVFVFTFNSDAIGKILLAGMEYGAGHEK